MPFNLTSYQFLIIASSVGQRSSSTFVARNMVPDISFQGYWRAVIAGADFPGLKIQDCLGVIHTDIVNIWNFRNTSEV